MSTARAVCDGFDLATEYGVLHFDHEPTGAEVATIIAALTAPAAPAPTIEVVAEDGTVCDA